MSSRKSTAAGERLGIALRVASTVAFAAMVACVKALGDAVPLGQVVFFRSGVALAPLTVFLWWHGDFPQGLKTRRPFGHVARCSMGATAMSTSFATIRLLPLAEATMLSYLASVMVALLGWAKDSARDGSGRWASGSQGSRPSARRPSRATFPPARWPGFCSGC